MAGLVERPRAKAVAVPSGNAPEARSVRPPAPSTGAPARIGALPPPPFAALAGVEHSTRSLLPFPGSRSAPERDPVAAFEAGHFVADRHSRLSGAGFSAPDSGTGSSPPDIPAAAPCAIRRTRARDTKRRPPKTGCAEIPRRTPTVSLPSAEDASLCFRFTPSPGERPGGLETLRAPFAGRALARSAVPPTRRFRPSRRRPRNATPRSGTTASRPRHFAPRAERAPAPPDPAALHRCPGSSRGLRLRSPLPTASGTLPDPASFPSVRPAPQWDIFAARKRDIFRRRSTPTGPRRVSPPPPSCPGGPDHDAAAAPASRRAEAPAVEYTGSALRFRRGPRRGSRPAVPKTANDTGGFGGPRSPAEAPAVLLPPRQPLPDFFRPALPPALRGRGAAPGGSPRSDDRRLATGPTSFRRPAESAGKPSRKRRDGTLPRERRPGTPARHSCRPPPGRQRRDLARPRTPAAFPEPPQHPPPRRSRSRRSRSGCRGSPVRPTDFRSSPVRSAPLSDLDRPRRSPLSAVPPPASAG